MMTAAPLFADHHQAYIDAGWSGVLLLPPGAKHAPPTGYTGAGGAWPTRRDIERWAREQPDGNIGLRLPRDVIGVDVDLYRNADARTVLEERTGPLPPTWCSTSRVDGSGIRFYRVPVPPSGTVWQGAPVPGVEIIQHHHRYAVVWPSLHPEGRPYIWVDEASGEVSDRPPEIDELTELTWQAIAALTQAHDPGTARAPVAFELPRGEMSATVERRLMAAIAATRGDRGSRHDAACRDVAALMRLAERGEPGVGRALELLRDAFCAAVAPDRPGAGAHAEREFDDIVAGAERLIAATEGRIPTRTERDHEWQQLRAPTLGPRSGPGEPGAQRVDERQATRPDPYELALDALRIVDWPAFWSGESEGPDWLVEPIIARGRGHALYAGAKSGKSLLMLAACAAVASGKPFLNNPARPPQHILYLDYEMTADDLRERLETFGYGPEDDLSHLHYALLPTIDPLDTEMGAAAVVAAAQHFGAVHVVIDTTSRAISGEENSADTFRAFYRLTGLRLKAAGIGYHRLDHSGKDIQRGQRGSSAKNDDVDVVQQLAVRDKGAITLKATHRRMSWVPESVDISRSADDGVLAYATAKTVYPNGTFHLVRWLDDNGVDLGLGRNKVRELMSKKQFKASNDALTAAIKIRKDRARDGVSVPETAVGQVAGQVVIHSDGQDESDSTDSSQNSWSDVRTGDSDSFGQVAQAQTDSPPHVVGDSPGPETDRDDEHDPDDDDNPFEELLK